MWLENDFLDPPDAPRDNYDSVRGQLSHAIDDDAEWEDAQRDLKAEAARDIAIMKGRMAAPKSDPSHVDAVEALSKLTPIEFTDPEKERRILEQMDTLTREKVKGAQESLDPDSYNPNIPDLDGLLTFLKDAYYSHAVVYGVGEKELIEMYKQALQEIADEKFDASDIKLPFDFKDRTELGKNRHPYIVEHSTQIDYNERLKTLGHLQKFDKKMIDNWVGIVGTKYARVNSSRAVTKLEIPTARQYRVDGTMMSNALNQANGRSQVVQQQVISDHIAYVKARLESITPPERTPLIEAAVQSAVDYMNSAE